MNNETFRQQLLDAKSPAEVLELFNQEENRYFAV
jgi:mannitol/fructose-specific phosphotransferase system IIA component (Ntr-type)